MQKKRRTKGGGGREGVNSIALPDRTWGRRSGGTKALLEIVPEQPIYPGRAAFDGQTSLTDGSE